MNPSNPETTPEPVSQPARITRRSFVKRTGATVIVTVLALHAFRNEALAAPLDGYQYDQKLDEPVPASAPSASKARFENVVKPVPPDTTPVQSNTTHRIDSIVIQTSNPPGADGKLVAPAQFDYYDCNLGKLILINPAIVIFTVTVKVSTFDSATMAWVPDPLFGASRMTLKAEVNRNDKTQTIQSYTIPNIPDGTLSGSNGAIQIQMNQLNGSLGVQVDVTYPANTQGALSAEASYNIIATPVEINTASKKKSGTAP
jgi:hypothetical protein